jgi:hypothetical protein
LKNSWRGIESITKQGDLIGLTAIPSDVMVQFVNLMDTRSKANFSRVCQQTREIMEKTMKLPLSTLGFTLYLTDELFAADMYQKLKEPKRSEEWATLQLEVEDIWFQALSGNAVINCDRLCLAVLDLSANRAWSDEKIKKLGLMLKYELRKEIPNDPKTWSVAKIKSS